MSLNLVHCCRAADVRKDVAVESTQKRCLRKYRFKSKKKRKKEREREQGWKKGLVAELFVGLV